LGCGAAAVTDARGLALDVLLFLFILIFALGAHSADNGSRFARWLGGISHAHDLVGDTIGFGFERVVDGTDFQLCLDDAREWRYSLVQRWLRSARPVVWRKDRDLAEVP
jgi:hypothetical protein